jgi:hypothetical protein
MNGKLIGILALVGIMMYVKKVPVANAAVVDTAASALLDVRQPGSVQDAQAIADEVAAKLESVARAYPDDPALASHIAQAKASAGMTLQVGIALAEDPGAKIFAEQLQAYQQYRAAGGTKDFETLTLYSDWRNWQAQLTAPTPVPAPTPAVVVAAATPIATQETAYAQAAAEAEQTGGIVTWSSGGGYVVMPASEMYNPAYM